MKLAQEWESVEATAKVGSTTPFSDPLQGKMLEGVDLDLNVIPKSSNSLKEALKQTMLFQEATFRSQVFELQQLYKLQIATLEGFKQKDSDNLHRGGISPIPTNLNYPFKSSTKPLDLQLSADEFISQCADDISGYSKFVLNSSLDIPNLSLSIGRDAGQMVEEKRSRKGMESCTSSFGSIDLNNENLSFSKSEEHIGLASISAASNNFTRQKHKLYKLLDEGKQKLESNSQIGVGSSNGSTLNRSIGGDGLSCQPESRCNSGRNGNPGNFVPAYHLSENQMLFKRRVNDLDLNEVQIEDLSYFSNDQSMVVNVASSVSPASCEPLTEMHNIQQKDVNFEDMGEKFSKDGKFIKVDGAYISYIDLDPDSSEELCGETSTPKKSRMEVSSKISNGLPCRIDLNDAIGAESNLGKAAEPSSESECMTDHHSSSLKTMQSAVGSDDINFLTSVEREKIQVSALAVCSGEQDVRSSDSTESNTQCIIRKEPEEIDGTVQTMAELLVLMSSEPQACCQSVMSNTPTEEFQNKEDDQPQRSLDSYEIMVLQTEEMSLDDSCASSNAFLVDETEKKDLTYKLKRGTRMRDFRKDILPSLSTLSRNEIREDINILHGAIKSREYKRMRAKMADGGGDLCKSTKSKRSRASRK